MDLNNDLLLKTLGPAAFTCALLFAYRKYLRVPNPYAFRFPVRNHIIKGKLQSISPPITLIIPFPLLDHIAYQSVTDPNKLFLKVLSYNILADCYSKYFMFKYVNHGYLHFPFRARRILNEIKEANCDIICLQEMDHYHDFYKGELESLGYALQSTFRRNRDAVVVGYKREMFKIRAKEAVDYNELSSLYGDESALKMHNKALICLLQHVLIIITLSIKCL